MLTRTTILLLLLSATAVVAQNRVAQKNADLDSVGLDSLQQSVTKMKKGLAKRKAQLNSPTDSITLRLDSLKQKFSLTGTDSLKPNVPSLPTWNPATKLATMTDSIPGGEALNEKVNGLQQKTVKRIEGATLEVDGRVYHPDVNAGNISDKIPGAPAAQFNGGDLTQQLPATEVINGPSLNMPDQSLSLPVTNASLPNINAPDFKTGDMDGLKKDLPAISGQKEFTDALSKAGEIGKELPKVNKDSLGALSETAEKKIETLAPVADFKRGVAPATQKQAEYQAMMQRYKDSKSLEAEIRRKMETVANDQVNQFTPQVKHVMGEMERNKKKLFAAKQFGDTVKIRRINQMKGKPFVRRLVPGFTYQLIHRGAYRMDLGPQLGYRLTGHVTAGIGGSYRFGINKSNRYYLKGEHVFTGRLYATYGGSKGWFAQAEMMWVNQKANNANEPSTQLIGGTNVGLGKAYHLSKRLIGYALVLYRFEWKGHLDDQSKLNLRVGLNFDTRKRKIKTINNVRIRL